MNYQRRPGTRNVHTAPGSSRSLKQAQEISSPADRPARPGRTLVTTNHDVIRRWAEQRGARPATMPGSAYNGRLGVLRLELPGYGGAVLQPVAWDEWFANFDLQGLSFRYQEQWADGSPSNFNRLEGVNRTHG
ncbi:hypothetical protein ACFQZZ_25745 [Nocardia sp. GCM10030253]|uniref:hypothetical protein n=1 Tax=Nocardia sp. GCM10030253 TaxID=3273404 RepID=UPI00363E1728